MTAQKTFYLTKQGLKELEQEQVKLKEQRRLKLGKETPSVLSSEELNTEFVSFREELDYLDVRLEELDCILKNYQLIALPAKKDRNKISLGAEVVMDVNGATNIFQLVGTLEANPSLGKISNESPVGIALLGCQAGDTVVITVPKRKVYRIKKVNYQN